MGSKWLLNVPNKVTSECVCMYVCVCIYIYITTSGDRFGTAWEWIILVNYSVNFNLQSYLAFTLLVKNTVKTDANMMMISCSCQLHKLSLYVTEFIKLWPLIKKRMKWQTCETRHYIQPASSYCQPRSCIATDRSVFFLGMFSCCWYSFSCLGS